MPAEDERRSLIRDRDYLTDRLSEISKDLNRFAAESTELKQEAEGASAADADRFKAIRRRRFYLRRFSDELKVERQRIMTEHQRLIAELADDSTAEAEKKP